MAKSFLTLMVQAAREADRETRRRQREAEREARASQRLSKIAHKEMRLAEVDQLNSEIRRRLEELERLLPKGLATEPLDWEMLEPVPQVEMAPYPPPLERLLPPPLPPLYKLFAGPRKRHEVEQEKARAAHDAMQERYLASLTARNTALAARNSRISGVQADFREGDPGTVSRICELALALADLPEDCPKQARAAYIAESKRLVVDYEMPTVEIIPTEEKFRWVQSGDRIIETKRSTKSRQSLYSNSIASIALRSIHQLYALDYFGHIDTVVFNGYVDTIDPSTGKPVKPYILSLSTTREEFDKLELRQVDPVQCLKRLKAVVSRSPAELEPVKPIVEISTYDPRFIQEDDVLSRLDSRTNLMDLTPGQFESLITNLFQKMGLDTKLTQASRDGGVDCVAFDMRPILGGKVIVQAKRYKNTVGVSAVRDLFGTVHNEGATKGILVTTSGFGSATFDFARDKPLELIDGANLLYLLKEHAGLDAKIVPPDDWIDQTD